MTARARRGALWLVGCLAACAAPPATESRPALDSKLPPELTARIDAIFLEWDRPESPGCALAVIREGEVVYARGYGMANLEHVIPIAPDTVFDIGSTSKQFTAACVVMLALDGKLSLDDDVRKWIPELPDLGAPITLRNLLHHTSGIRDYCELMMIAGFHSEDLTTDTQALEMLARQRELNFPPGSKHEYSNSGYFLLSVVVERAAGKPLADVARERLFEPLGMRDTHVHDDHGRIVPRRATGYSPRREGGIQIEMSDWEQTGDGAVMTTVLDLAKWDRNFETGAVGGPAFLERMGERGKLADGTELAYGFGLTFNSWPGLPTVAHGGAWAGYRAQLLRFPTERLSIVCLCNLASMNPTSLARRVAREILGEKLGPRGEESRPASAPRPDTASRPDADATSSPAEPEAAAPRDFSEYAGTYECPELDAHQELFVRDGALWVRVRGNADGPLPWKGSDTISTGGVQFDFQRDALGHVIGFLLDTGRVHHLRFAKTP